MIGVGNKILIPASANTTLKNGLIACDEFDNSTIVLESPNVGSGYDSTTKKLGTHSFKFASFPTDEYVDIQHMLYERYSKTIAVWVYFQTGASFGIEYSNQSDSGYYIVQVTKTNILIILRDSSGEYLDRRKSGLNYSGWKHIIFTTENNQTAHIYVDNTEVTLVADDYGTPTPNFDSYPNSGYFLSTYPTYIDQYAVWGRILTSEEMALLYNSGNGLISSEW